MNETITITGNVATDPQHKHAGGVAITTFRVASNLQRLDRATGTWVDSSTNWYTVSTYRQLADHAFASLRRGDRVLLTGRLKVSNWDTGAKKGTTVEIDADAIGHDLLFGTSRFEKDERAAGRDESRRVPTDEWATPGVTDDPAVEWAVAAVPADDAEPRPLELAGVDAPF